MISVGQQAPDFNLLNTQKELVQLSSLKGQKVLLLFFPLAFTGVCTEELCSIRDGISFYNDAKATVLGISVDSAFTLEQFKNQQNLNFELLSDFNKEASTAYGAIFDTFPFGEMKGVSKRSAFVIDEAGVIQYAEVLESPGDLPNFEAIQQVLA